MKRRIVLLGCLPLMALLGFSTGARAASSIPATSFQMTPAPSIAPEGTLAPGQEVTITLTAYAGNAIDPHALVWISFTSTWPNGHLAYGGQRAFGILTVNSPARKFNANDNEHQYQVSAAGTLTMTFAAATTAPPKAGFSDGIYARTTPGGKASTENALAYTLYTYSS
jgi:hypothetical protein